MPSDQLLEQYLQSKRQYGSISDELKKDILRQSDEKEGFIKDDGLGYFQNKIAEEAKNISKAAIDPEYWEIAAGKTPEVATGLARVAPNIVGFPVDAINLAGAGSFYTDKPVLGSEWLAEKLGLPERTGSSTEFASEIFGEFLLPTPRLIGKALYGLENLTTSTLKSLGKQIPDLLDAPLLQKAIPLQLAITPSGPRLTAPTDKPVYHVTFSEHVPSIKEKGLLHFYGEGPNWDMAATGDAYNPTSGIFAFENPEDALKWSITMGDAFNSPVSIVKLKRQKGFKTDPSQDPQLTTGKGKSLVLEDDPVPVEDIMESFELGILGKEKPTMLEGKKVQYSEWVDSWRQKLAGPGKKSGPKERILDSRGFYIKSYEAAKDFPEHIAGAVPSWQFKKFLNKKKGISNSEMKWLELDELFQNNPTVTKQQVLDTIDKNRIELDVKIARDSGISGTTNWTETTYEGMPLKSTLDESDKFDYEDQKRQVIFDNLFDDPDIIGKPTGQLEINFDAVGEGMDAVSGKGGIPIPSSDKIFIPLSKSFLSTPSNYDISFFNQLSRIGANASKKDELLREIGKRRKIIKEIVEDKINTERYINGSEFNRMYEELSQIHTNVLKGKIPHEQFIENLIDSRQKLNKLIEKEKLRAQTHPEYYNAINTDLDPLIDEMSDIVVHQRFIGDPFYLRYEDVLSNTQLEKVTKSKSLQIHVDEESGYHIIGNDQGWEIYKGKPNFKEGDLSRFRRYTDTPVKTRREQLESAGDWDLIYNYTDDPNLTPIDASIIADSASVKVFDNLNEAKVQARNLYNQSQGISPSEGRIAYTQPDWSDPTALTVRGSLDPQSKIIERIEGKTVIKKGYGKGIQATKMGEGHYDVETGQLGLSHFKANVLDAGNGETAYYPYESQSDALKVAHKYGVYDKLPVSVRKQKAEEYKNDWGNFLARVKTVQKKYLRDETTRLMLEAPSTGVDFSSQSILDPQMSLNDVTGLLRHLERQPEFDAPSGQKAIDDLIKMKKNLEDDIFSMSGGKIKSGVVESAEASEALDMLKPELPFLDPKNPGKTTEVNLKQALRDAAERGDDWFVLPESEFHTNLWSPDIRDEYYDTETLQKLADKKTTIHDFKFNEKQGSYNLQEYYNGEPIANYDDFSFRQLQKGARRVLWLRQHYNEVIPGSASKIADEIGGTFEKKFFKALEDGDTERSLDHVDVMSKTNEKYPKKTETQIADESFDDIFFGREPLEEGAQTKREAYVDWLRNRTNPGAGKYKYRKETINFVPGERMAMRLTPEIREAILKGGFKLPLKEGGVVPSNEGIMSIKDRAVNMFQKGGGVYNLKDKAVNMFQNGGYVEEGTLEEGTLEDSRFEPKRISEIKSIEKSFEEIEEEKREAALVEKIMYKSLGIDSFIPSLKFKPYVDVRGGVSEGSASFIDEEGRPTTVDTGDTEFGGTVGIEILFPNKWKLRGGASGNYLRGSFGEKSFGEGFNVTGGYVGLQIPF